MRMEQLQYLIDLAQTGSLSKTAQNFYMTQQGLGNALKKLEQEFHTQLYIRTSHGVSLTAMGQYFAAKGSEMLAIYQNLMEQTSHFNDTYLTSLQGTLSLITHPRIFQYILPSIITTFSSSCPHIRLHIIEEPHNAFWSQTDYGQEFDFGLAALNHQILESPQFLQPFVQKQLTLTTLYIDDLVVCMHRSSPYRDKNIFTDEELRTLPVISYGLNMIQELPEHTVRNIFTSSNLETHRWLVTQGLAVSVMSCFEYHKAYGDSNQFIAIPIQRKKIAIVLVTSAQKSPSPQAAYFISLLKKFPYQ